MKTIRVVAAIIIDNGKVLNKSLATVVIGDEIFERTSTGVFVPLEDVT